MQHSSSEADAAKVPEPPGEAPTATDTYSLDTPQKFQPVTLPPVQPQEWR